ncbi:outer membrane protein assembly factor BamE [Rhodobacteraceae bacterium SC52]|nr:outer membrane protein assembly factor BamE [Rhodobacteraceae bacterium SC52]
MAKTSLAHELRLLLGAALCATLVSCSPIERSHGYVPADDQLAEIAVGDDTRDSVIEKIGAPLTRGVEDEDAWYYVSSERRTIGPFAPVTTKRDIVAVRFSDAGTVENIERFNETDGQVVVLTARVTDPSVSELGILRRIFGNVGTPSAGDFLGEGN